MSLHEIEEIERIMRHDPARYRREGLSKRYYELIAKDPAFRMTKTDLLSHANEHEAADKVASQHSLDGVSDLMAFRQEQLRHRDDGAAYRRLIADQEEGGRA